MTTFSAGFMLLFVVALLFSSIGFKKYIWFISIGYGFSIAGIGLFCLTMFKGIHDAGTIILSTLLILYGIRLGGYLLYRERRSDSYNSNMKGEIKDGTEMKLYVKAAIWVSCALLYVFETAPVFYRLHNGVSSDAVTYTGAAIMLLGTCFESLADVQKSEAKKREPKNFCSTGLYKIVRCPNYLGEMIFWTGVLVSGVTALKTPGQWIIALLGYLGIVYIMFSGARRLEIRQNKRYGRRKAYKEYVAKTPILIPFVPLYSVEKYKWLVG